MLLQEKFKKSTKLFVSKLFSKTMAQYLFSDKS